MAIVVIRNENEDESESEWLQRYSRKAPYKKTTKKKNIYIYTVKIVPTAERTCLEDF